MYVTEGDSEGSTVSSLCWAQPPQKFCRHQWEGIGILCTWSEWYFSNTAVSWFFASVSKASLLEHCRRQQRGPGKQCIPFYFLFSSRENVAKNKEGLVGVPCGAETKLRVWFLMFSKSPVRQQVPFFFFLVGVVTRSSARTWQNEGKKPIRLGKGKLLPKQKNPPWKTSLRNWPTLARAQAKSVSEEQTEKGLTL